MLSVSIYNQSGQKVGEQQVSPAVFGVKTKPELVQQVIIAEQTRARQPLAHTKTRGEVRGGGKKPWKQKGTGQARQGSIRSPQWKGGGVVFGPRSNRNYSLRINKKMKRKALLMALSDKLAQNHIVVMDHFEVSGKTKDWQVATKKVWSALAAKRRIPTTLFMTPSISMSVKRSTKNVPGVEAIRTDSLNLTSLLKHEYTLTTVDGLKALEAWLTKA